MIDAADHFWTNRAVILTSGDTGTLAPGTLSQPITIGAGSRSYHCTINEGHDDRGITNLVVPGRVLQSIASACADSVKNPP